MKYRSTKRYIDLPCAHRQHAHTGHCRFVHGYSRSFKFYFEASKLDGNNFVVDFSALEELSSWLKYMFDHTLLINESDPELAFFQDMHSRGLCDLRTMPSVSMEGTAKYVYDHTDKLIREQTKGRCWVVKVEAHENEKNSAEYAND